MRVAFTSTDGQMVDQHFGMTEQFYVWEVGPGGSEFAGKVSAIARAEGEEDRIAARATAIADCTIVYTQEIGGPAAAKLVSRRIQPMKTGAQALVPIADLVAKLEAVLKGRPPPWLRKAMAKGGAPASPGAE